MSDVFWELLILSNAIFAFFSSGLQLAQGNGIAAGWAALTGMWVVALYFKIRTTAVAAHKSQANEISRASNPTSTRLSERR